MRVKNIYAVLFGIVFLVTCLIGFSSTAIAEQGVEERVEELEVKVEELHKEIAILGRLVGEMLGRTHWKVTLEKTVIDRSYEDEDEVGDPDIRVAVHLNGKPVFDTMNPPSGYLVAGTNWYARAGVDSYSVNWVEDLSYLVSSEALVLSKEEQNQMWRKLCEGLSIEFEFGLGDNLAVTLSDYDSQEDDLVAIWKIDNIAELGRLVKLTSNGHYVSFGVERP